MKVRLYIDGNSVGHAAQHGHGKNGRGLHAGGRETTAIFGMLKSVQKLVRTRTTMTTVILWDGRSWRYNFFDDYKGNRTDTAEKVQERERYKAQRKDMFRGLHLLGINQLVAANMEADDMAAVLTRRAIAAGNMVTLITGDQDWLQLVQQGVAWVDHKIERKCTVTDFQEFTGYRTPRAFVHSKALQGDSGDNVKPKTGIGEAGAQALLAVFDDVHDFLRTPLDEAAARYKAHHGKNLLAGMKKFHADPEMQARFEWALQLTDLSHPAIPAPERMQVTRAPLNRPAFEAFCAEFGFTSLLRDMDNFLKPFITLEEEMSK